MDKRNYQPLESTYQLTRKCLEILAKHGWPVIIQTRSPYVLRDLDFLKDAASFEVGFSIATADDRVKGNFEPKAPPVQFRGGGQGQGSCKWPWQGNFVMFWLSDEL